VHYRGHNKAMEAKIPKGKVHDPYSYEIETWAQLEPLFPKAKRVNYAKVVPILEHRVESSPSAKRVAAGDGAKPSPQANAGDSAGANAGSDGIQPARTPREGGAA
jgi:hypothetical protein